MLTLKKKRTCMKIYHAFDFIKKTAMFLPLIVIFNNLSHSAVLINILSDANIIFKTY